MTVDELSKQNGIKGDLIHPGQVLVVKKCTTTSHSKPAGKSGTSYTVKAGDSVWLIANRYDVSMDDLVKLNKIKNYTIHPGQVLTIQTIVSTPAKPAITTTPKVEDQPVVTIVPKTESEVLVEKASGAKGKLDVSSKSFESLTAGEKKVVESLLEQGKDVKLIPEAPNVSKTPDLLVNGIETEIKTLNGNNINTLVTKVGKALKQVDGKGKIVYDISKANFTPQQMDEIISRLIGKYGKDIVDRITFIK
ncbi:LysM peptidoglycan-binding domain-containing protein [Enterococcus innesii]|uniref:LysM peptidoglycan-binding domain-containing protein n=1 Tax=Enterococcus innesii TaxID=2839759 RepID=UPI003F6A1B8A